MKSKILPEKEIEKLSDKELAEYLGPGRPIPKSAWRKEVRDLSAVGLIRLHRRELEEKRKKLSKLKTLEELREEKSEFGPLFATRKRINGRGGPLTKSEEIAFNEGFKKGNDALWFNVRQEAIKWIKQDRFYTSLFAQFFNITEKELEEEKVV